MLVCLSGLLGCRESAVEQPAVGDVVQWKLPDRLREISGLALTNAGGLLAVDDERAVVYELDYDSGGILREFSVGDPVLKGDFEGLAVLGSTLFLMDSDGDLYRSVVGSDDEHVRVETVPTGLGEQCEFEGLTSYAKRLYLLCKAVYDDGDRDGLTVFVWDTESDRLLSDEHVTLPEAEIGREIAKKRLHPSGIAVHPQTGNWVIVAARQAALIEMSPTGRLLSARPLPEGIRHPQAEGIEFTEDGRLLIADEGGKGKARLTMYTNLSFAESDR